MGGPWRDRTHLPNAPVSPSGKTPAFSESPSSSGLLGIPLLQAYLTGLILGAILGTVALWLAIPYLPFADGR